MEKSPRDKEAFKRIMDMKTNVAVRRQNLNVLKPSHEDYYNLNPMFKKTQKYVNDVSLMRNPKKSKSKLKELHQSEEAKLLKDVAEFRVDEGIRLKRDEKNVDQLVKNPFKKLKRIDTDPQMLSFNLLARGGKKNKNKNKKIYVGPNGGKYVKVKCDGKIKKRYLKNK